MYYHHMMILICAFFPPALLSLIKVQQAGQTDSMEATPSDAFLVQRAQQGDRQALAALYDSYQTRIFRYVRVRIYDQQLAQDLTGEIFLHMMENLSKYRVMEGVPFSAWLYRLAHNHLINHFRKDNNQVHEPLALLDELADGDDNPALAVEKRQELQRVREALEQIDINHREVVVLRFLLGMSIAEVAAALEKSVPAVKALQYRGILTLQALLK